MQDNNDIDETQITHIWGNGISQEDAISHTAAKSIVSVAGMLFSGSNGEFVVKYTITGTFDAGEGADLEIKATAFGGEISNIK